MRGEEYRKDTFPHFSQKSINFIQKNVLSAWALSKCETRFLFS